MAFKILPSLLSADLMHLGNEVDLVIKAGIDLLHLDIMDNHYVPNLSFGTDICKFLNAYAPKTPIDVHLMTKPVDNLIQKFANFGASRISIHPDATIHLNYSLQLIRSLNCMVGIALNPADSLDSLAWSHQFIDFVLIMTVNPGFGGQELIPEIIYKITQVNKLYPDLPICVDGGVTVDNIAILAKAGAKEFVAGSSIFKSKDYSQTVSLMRKKEFA